MPRLVPPLGVYDKNFARAVGKAYRQAYATCQNGSPHASGMGAARQVFIMYFPFPTTGVPEETVRNILAAIDNAHPGWLLSGRPRRDPTSSADASMEANDLNR